MREGDEPVKKTSRKSLRLLGSVGEPINPEAWQWYHRVVGDGPLPDRRHLVADRDRRHPDHAAARRHRPQARLGDPAVLRRAAGARRQRRQACSRARARAISCIARQLARPDAHGLRRPRALRPDLLLDLPGHVLHRRRRPPRRGRLLLDHRPRRRRDQRLRPPHGHGRGRERAGRAPDGRRGRGGRLSRTTSRARASTATSRCKAGDEPSEALRKELVGWVRKEIGPIATPDVIQWAPGLPKTRSGKIMRRILRKIAANEYGQLGDTSTLADPGRGRRPGGQPPAQVTSSF